MVELGLNAPLCHPGPQILSLYHIVVPLHIDVLSTGFLPCDYKLAATVPDAMPSHKCPKHKGVKGWIESGLSFIREEKPTLADFSVHFFG